MSKMGNIISIELDINEQVWQFMWRLKQLYGLMKKWDDTYPNGANKDLDFCLNTLYLYARDLQICIYPSYYPPVYKTIICPTNYSYVIKLVDEIEVDVEIALHSYYYAMGALKRMAELYEDDKYKKYIKFNNCRYSL